MEGSNRAPSSSSSSHFNSASSSNVETSGANVEGAEIQGGETGNQQLIRQRMSVPNDAFEENLQLIRVSCAVVIPGFWFFVSMTMIFGIYGPSKFMLGPNSSILIRPNSLFVQYLKVEELDEASNHPKLYGFSRTPPLDVVTTFSEIHKTFLPARSHEEWVYFLNQGSQMNVSYTVNYTVNYQGFAPVIFVIAQGIGGHYEWLEDPSNPNFTLSWNTIHGSGMIQQDIYTSSTYYAAVANLNAEAVEVKLNVKIRASLYNTRGAYYTCSLSHGECHLELSLGGGNIGLLTSPPPSAGRGGDQWKVKLSYGPRWVSYITGTAIMIVIVLLLFRLLNKFEHGHGRIVHSEGRQSERAPMLSNKDNDLSSWGSSYECLSEDDENHEDAQAICSKDGEYNNTCRLCAICFDAHRDCFFLPCGHCVACFACGTRIAEAAGSCPICRRHMKKVRKIFTV